MKEGDALKELADVVEGWHAERLGTIVQIVESGSKDEITLKHPGGELKIEGEMLKGFRAGLQVCIELFKDLPFKLEEREPDELDQEDEDDEAVPVKDLKVEETPKPEGYGSFA